MSYKSLVRPQIEYCNTICIPHNKCHIYQLEALQNRADFQRYSSVTKMKSNINLESLESRRKINKAILFYKIQNNLVDVTLNLRQSAHFSGKFTQIQCRTTAYHRSFVPDSVIILNTLSTTATSSISLEAFKTSASSELIHLY